MKKDKLNEDILLLNLDNKIINILKENKINTVNDLWKLSRKDLKTMGLRDHNISQIIINLQLRGIDLNEKKY